MNKLTSRQSTLLNLYKYMVASRESDIVESELVNSGEANFLASSKGHEGSVILAPLLKPQDWLHCHYRDKALMLARGISSEMFFYSALAKAESHSHGRQMVSHMSAPELNIMSIVGPVGNSALQAAGVASVIKDTEHNPIVLCAIGDGTSQQGEVFEAIAETKRSNLPVLFFIHNNNLAISTRTAGKTFFSLPDGKLADSFYDIPITYLDGCDSFTGFDILEQLVSKMRVDRAPQIVVFNVDRLDNHSNADDQKLYRKDAELAKCASNDPLTNGFDYLLKDGVSKAVLLSAKADAIYQVRESIDVARHGSEPVATLAAEKPLPTELMATSPEYRGDFAATDRLTMLEAMRQVFYTQLEADARVCLLGEDIEDGKGDVFGITRGLSTKFPNQVKNSALSESTIIGLTGGMALAGMRPVAFIQFADFMPLAYNQIFSELATMYWRSNGRWQCPVIVFAACGAYRPGLGPFHSQTNEATYAHIPGLDVYMPSNAADAVGMLNAAFKSGRPSLFLYPKKLLNAGSVEDTTSADIAQQLIPVGKARIAKAGSDITLIGWGNTVALCKQVADTLDTIGVDVEIIDLRTIKPYDLATILASVEKTRHLCVTHEDNHTCGVGGDILASVAELAKFPVKMSRVTRADTYTPCNFANQLEVLPSYEKILTACAKLLDIELTWQHNENTDATAYIVEVIGASPSDESVLINKIHVKVGDQVESGDILVDIEASKSAGEILSPCSGVIEEILVKEAETAFVGGPLVKIRLAQAMNSLTQKKSSTPILKRKSFVTNVNVKQSGGIYPVGICLPTYKTGSRLVTNQEILVNFPDLTSADIIKRTGIETRYWLAENETLVGIATDVTKNALTAAGLQLSDISMIICATCTPEDYQTPSLACFVLDQLYATYGEQHIPAYDINAACSGYIYALQNAKDYLQTRPNERVLIITAESLSRRVNPKDFETAFLFGDAATCTVVCGNDYISSCNATIDENLVTAIAENGDVLNIPSDENSKVGITMQGKKLFTFAVKTMALVMNKCAQKAGVAVEDIGMVIPHQANQRILSAVEHRLSMPEGSLYSNIARYGNTSSCTIPIALGETLLGVAIVKKVALCAFGGGFTAGATILTVCTN